VTNENVELTGVEKPDKSSQMPTRPIPQILKEVEDNIKAAELQSHLRMRLRGLKRHVKPGKKLSRTLPKQLAKQPPKPKSWLRKLTKQFRRQKAKLRMLKRKRE